MASIDTLIEDIQRLFTEGHDCNPANIENLGKAIAEVVQARLTEALKEREPFRLRMSNLGKHPKQLWYEAHADQTKREPLDASARIKFLFGDILERLLIFLAKEAGHEVTDEQKQVELDGIKGSLDCRIDGHLVDVKSASTRSFFKFKDGSLRRNDTFGYMWQLAGYNAAGQKQEDGGFLVIDKTLGHICFMPVPAEEFKLYDVRGRIVELRAVIANPEPPDRCFEDVEDGKSGNRKLATGCSYCWAKRECWPGLQVFSYANGPRFMTKVIKEPRVEKEVI